MFPQPPQNPLVVDWYLLHKAQVGLDATLAPKWPFGFKLLNARKQPLITLGHASDRRRVIPIARRFSLAQG